MISVGKHEDKGKSENRMEKRIPEELVNQALEARQKAYTPYSHFAVGAALLCADGTIYQGCNIENAAYTPTNCAERTAFFKAVSEGRRDFTAMAIVGGPQDSSVLEYCAPCGVCRQVMREFCRDDFEIYLGSRSQDGRISYERYTLEELLPMGFGPDNLGCRM